MKGLETRARKAVVHFLGEIMGYEILEDDLDGFIVFKDDDRRAVVFSSVEVKEFDGGSFDAESADMDTFESVAAPWMFAHPDVFDGSWNNICFDCVSMIANEETGKAMIRHHRNLFAEKGV